MSFIEIKKLSYTYEGEQEPALSDINFNIEEGEFVAVLGESGSGKSTLALLLAALKLPTSGDILVDSMNSKAVDPLRIRRRVGVVFQNPDNNIVAATVEDDVAFGPENLGVPREEIVKRVDEALKATGLEEVRTGPPHLLSGGQKQRLAIAGILAMEPKCLVLDEPTSMLDPQGRDEIIDAVKKLRREKNLAVVYITHFMEEAMEADKVLLMEKGRIKKEGTPKETLTEISLLRELGLDAPLAVQIADILRKRGIPLPLGIFRDEELVAAIKEEAKKS